MLLLQLIKQLQKETSVIAKLNHKRIVQFIREEMDLRAFCLYMEFMPNGSVSARIEKTGPFSESTTKKCAFQILEGLEYLHDRRIIHRHLKGRLKIQTLQLFDLN